MNLRKTLRKTLLENTSNTTAYYCCDDSDLLACNAGGPYYDPYINQNNVIALNMYSPGSPLNIIYGTAFPQGYPYNPWSSIQDYQDWCNDPMVSNQSGQVGAWCDVVVDSVTSYPVKCGGIGIDTFGDTVSMKKPETRKGFQDDVEELRRKGRRRSQSHGYGCDCGDGNYDKTCCTGLSESKQCKSGMYWCKKSEKCKPINKSKRKREQTTSGAAGAFSQPVFGKPIKRSIGEQTLNPGAGTNTQTIQGGQCDGDIIADYTITDYTSLIGAFVHLVNNYGMSADFRDYAFTKSNGDYVNLEIDIHEDGGVVEYFSIDEIHETYGTGPFTTVQELFQFFQGPKSPGSISLGTLLCTGVQGVDNSLPTVGLDSTGMGDGPGMPESPNKKIRRGKMKIGESEFIKLIEKSVYAATHGKIIKEALTDADEKRIGVLARKELKDYETKLEKKVDQAIKKALKGKDFETSTLKITRNAIIQLYKALWIRRSFWTDYIKNTPS